MKTSYYARFSRLPKEEKDRYMPILISNSLPKWFLDKEECYMEYKPLAPSSDNVFKLKNKFACAQYFGLKQKTDAFCQFFTLRVAFLCQCVFRQPKAVA